MPGAVLSLADAALLAEIDPVQLGTTIRLARQARGLRQSAIATPIVTAAYVSRIEAGQRRPSTKALAHFAERMSMSVSDLLHAADGDVSQTVFQTPVLAERVATATTLWLHNPTAGAYCAMIEAVAAWENHHTMGAAAAETNNAAGLREVDPTQRLIAASSALHDAEQGLRDVVDEVRAAGGSWAAIGEAFGVTRQAAFDRFSKPRESAAVMHR